MLTNAITIFENTYSFSELPVVNSGDVLGVYEGDNPRHGKSFGGVDLDHVGVGLAGEHKGCVQLVFPLLILDDYTLIFFRLVGFMNEKS